MYLHSLQIGKDGTSLALLEVVPESNIPQLLHRYHDEKGHLGMNAVHKQVSYITMIYIK